MLDRLEGHDGKHDIDEVWSDEDAAPQIVHRITLFDARDCPLDRASDKIWHIFGGSETVCGIVVSESSSIGNHIELSDEYPEVDCDRCLTIDGLRDPSLVVELAEPVSA